MPEYQLDLPAGVPPLTTYYYYLTNGCNLACKHCWIAPQYQPNGTTGGHLDFELFKLSIQQAIPLGLKSVKFTGGEPLLHPDFVRMVEYLNEREINLIMETNAVLMTEKMVDFLKERGRLLSISTSIDGATAQSHDAFRGVKGSFERTCNAVRWMSKAGLHPQVIMSIHAGNVDEIEPLVRLVENLGAGSVKFNLVQSTGRGETMMTRGQVLDIHRLIEIGTWVSRVLQPQVNIPLVYSWPMAFYSIKELRTQPLGLCGIETILGVLATGELAMCGIGTQVDELCYGKLGVDDVRDVWINSTILQDLRSNVNAEFKGVCNECLFKNTCRAACMAQNYYATQDLRSSFWFCQQAFEAGLFPQSRLRNASELIPA